MKIMMALYRIILNCGFIGLVTLIACDAVRVTNLRVPSTYTIENKNRLEPLVLDCEYEVGGDETGFFLKWFLNEVAIYQWIPALEPYALGDMKTKIDTQFSLSNDKVKHYRAISIIKPDINVTGEYTCSVSTFESTDSKSANLQIIVPESDFRLNTRVNWEHNSVEIICSVQDMFPQPQLTVMIDDKRLHASQKVKRKPNGMYDETVTAIILRQEIQSPTPINCLLILPGTNYTKRRETIFYDQGEPTTINPSQEEISSAISRLEASNKGLTHPTLSLAAIILIILAVSS